MLSLSSLGVVAKVLIDEGRLKEPVGVQMFTAVIIAELLALFVVGFAISEQFASEGADVTWTYPASPLCSPKSSDSQSLSGSFPPCCYPRSSSFYTAPAGAATLFGLLLGGLFLVVVGAELWTTRITSAHCYSGRALHIAIPSATRHHARNERHRRRISSSRSSSHPPACISISTSSIYPADDIGPRPHSAHRKVRRIFLGAYIARIEHPFAIASGLMAKGVAEIALLLLLFHTGAISQGVFSLLVAVMFGYILFTADGHQLRPQKLDRAETDTETDQFPPSLYHFALDGIKVNDILDRSRSHPDQSTTVEAFADQWLISGQHDYVVVDGPKFAGIVSLSMMRYLPRSEWDHALLERVLRSNTPVAKTRRLRRRRTPRK